MAKKDKKSKKSKDKDENKSKSKEKKGKDKSGDQGTEIRIENVRLSHPHIFERSSYEGKEGKFEATFMIPKDTKQGKATYKQIQDLIDAKVAASPLTKAPKGDKCCLRDGDKSDKPEYAGHWTLKASRNKRPAVLDGDGDQTTMDDEVIYAGCRVDAVIDVWVQNNQYGKRTNANLYGVMFNDDDEPFTSGLTGDEASDILRGKKGKKGKY